jgi:hypothetical protein
LLSLVVLAAVHVDDLYRMTHVSGVWMALARNVTEGTLYPPLYDGEHFGGTRFMPLQFALHAALAEATGEFAVSGKVLSFAIGLGLLGVTFVALRRLVGAPAWLALALVALLVPTHSGLTAVLSIRGDALPAALQVTALLAISLWAGRRGAVVAGLLCAAALLAKVTALWAPVAIVVWLLIRDRERLGTFVAAFAAPGAAALLLVELLSDGRFSDNVLGLAGSAVADPGAVVSALTTKPLTLLESDASAVWLVLPLAIAEVAIAWSGRRLALEHVAFLAVALMTLALMTDIGVVSNHLVDLQVLTVLVVGRLWVEQQAAVRVLVPIAVLWALVGAYLLDMHGDVKSAVRSAAGRGPATAAEPLSPHVPDGAVVLSEDATIEVDAGRHPVVLDPFMLVRILDEHPEWEADLVNRIERLEFDRVVLLADHVEPDGGIDVEHPRWEREHFGRAVVAAIDRAYRLRALTGGYAVYEPGG